MKISSAAPAIFLPWFIVSPSASPLYAHVVSRGAGTAALVSIQEEKIFITFDLSFSATWAQGEMLKMDSNRDGLVNEEEAEAYMIRTWEEKLAPALELKVDTARLPLKMVTTREANLVGEIKAVPVELYYEIEAELSPGSAPEGKDHLLEILNETLQKEAPDPPIFYMPMARESHAEDLTFQILEPPLLLDVLGPTDVYTMIGRKLSVKFRFRGARAPEPAPPEAVTAAPTASKAPPAPAAQASRTAAPAPAPPLPRMPKEERISKEDRFFNEAFSKSRDMGLLEVLGLVVLAIAYGAGHALAPGHGKTIVAAYLVGTKGRVIDALVLGITTMFTHTITVFIAGFGINLAIQAGAQASTDAMKNRIVVGTSLLSGALLFLMGLGLFLKRWRFAGDPEGMEHHFSHHHGHEHGHGEGQKDGGRPNLLSLIGLGASGGLVPCPAGIVVILLGLQYNRLLFSLFLLLFFSVSLGAVLVAIGIFVVTGKRFVPFRVSPRALSYLPALSALLITALGTYFTVQAFQTGRTEISAILEGLAEAIRR